MTLTGFALSKWLALSCALIFVGGAAIMASASLMLSLAQLSTTDAMRGRVMSVYNLAFRAGVPLGALALGRIIPIVGVSAALSGAGLMLVAVSAYFLMIRRQDSGSGADSEQHGATEDESSLQAAEAFSIGGEVRPPSHG